MAPSWRVARRTSPPEAGDGGAGRDLARTAGYVSCPDCKKNTSKHKSDRTNGEWGQDKIEDSDPTHTPAALVVQSARPFPAARNVGEDFPAAPRARD